MVGVSGVCTFAGGSGSVCAVDVSDWSEDDLAGLVESPAAGGPDVETVNAALVALGRARSAVESLDYTLAHHRRRHAVPVQAEGPSGWVDVSVLVDRVKAELAGIGPILDGTRP